MTDESKELLLAISGMFQSLDKRIDSVEENLNQKITSLDKKIDSVENNLNQKITSLDKKTDSVEYNVLEEIDTVQEKTNHHFDRIEKRLDQIEKELSVSKLQNDTLSLLIQRTDKIQDEIDILKKKVS